MTSVPEPVKIPSTSTGTPDEKASPSSIGVTQSILQRITDRVSAAIARSEKNAAENAAEASKDVVIEEVQISQQIPGRVYKLDPSQPLYDDDSHVFVYFILAMLICAFGYIVFHNKRKILALIIEGRQSHGDVRRSGGVNYKRLNTDPPGVSVA